MSLSKSATHRLSLLAGSSLVAMGLTAAASLGVALAPATAFAANECGNPSANGATADTFTCPVATYPTGIQHTSAGDLSVTVQTGTSPTLSNFGTGGVVSTGVGADDLTLRLTGSGTASSYSYNAQPFPALLNAESQSGDVVVEVEVDRTGGAAPTISANNAATTRAVRAVSTAGGDVTVRNISEGTNDFGVFRNGIIQSNANANAVAIEARSVGGGDITVDLGVGETAQGFLYGGAAQGRLYGILAQTDGAGAVSITGAGTANTSTTGSAGLRVVAGTGPVTIVGGQNNTNANVFSGRTGVYVNSAGDITFTGVARGSDYGLDIVNVAAGTTTTLNLGTFSGLSSSDVGTSGALAAVRAQGGGTLLVNVVGQQRAMNFDFAGMAAPVTVSVERGGAWRPLANAATTVGGNFFINIASDGALITGAQAGNNTTQDVTLEPATVLTFTGVTKSLNNAGYILVGPDNDGTSAQPRRHEAELRLVGLDEFRHSGTVVLGVRGQQAQGPRIQNVAIDDTDGWYDDLLVFQEGTWIGEGGNVLFDVDLNRTQTNCTREDVTFDFGAADCLRFVDATVEGQTYVNLRESLAGDRGRLNQQMMDQGVTLVEWFGDTTIAADSFAIDPQMRGYNAEAGTLDKGLYQYALLFDDDADQFRLFGTLSGAAYQLPMAATAAHSLWRVSTGSWLNRQADLRGSLQEGLGGGVWLRASGEQTERELVNISQLGGLDFAVDNSHRQDTYAVTGGLDLLSASDGHMGYVVGVMAGYAHADVEYEASANTQAMDAWTAGIYGGLVVGNLFVDALVNANNVIIDTDAPGFNFEPEGTILSSRMVSLGGQVEAGWRLLFPSGFFAEPLASVSYVRSKMEDLQIRPDDFNRPGLEVAFEDPSSFRAGVGARFGVDREFSGIRTQLSFLARTWNDLEGQNTAVIHNLAFPDDEDIRVTDEFSDQFNEVAVGASLWSPGGFVSGFLNLGSKFGEDYDAKTGSVGVRIAW